MLTFTLIHVVISLLAIGSGFVVLYGLLTEKLLNGWTGFFLTTTVLTSVTGFGFPAQQVTPAHVLGVISLAVLAAAIYARYARRLNGVWRQVYVVNAVLALYLNFFVLIAQAFQKVPALKALAPTMSETPFAAAQLAALTIFAVLGTFATLQSRNEPGRPELSQPA